MWSHSVCRLSSTTAFVVARHEHRDERPQVDGVFEQLHRLRDPVEQELGGGFEDDVPIHDKPPSVRHRTASYASF